MSPEIESKQQLEPVEQPQGLPDTYVTDMSPSHMADSKLGLAFATVAVAGTLALLLAKESYAKGKHHTRSTPAALKNRYHDNKDSFGNTVHSLDIEACQQLNVKKPKADTSNRFAYPYGSVESQRVKAKPGSKEIVVITKQRDVNLEYSDDSYYQPNPIEQSTEFAYGCSYTTDSVTKLVLRSKVDDYMSEPVEVKFQEDPRVFHKDHFVTKTFKTTFELPKRLSREDLAEGNYSISTTQTSAAKVRPFDPNAVEPLDPMLVTAASKYSDRLIDKTQPIAMLAENDVSPVPLSKTFKKIIRLSKQTTLKAPKKSPWTKKPRFTN